MAKGGYRHGKRREALPERAAAPRYLEDRVTALEEIVARLIKLARGALEREEAIVNHELAELDLKKREHAARKKKTTLQQSLKKPLKQKRRKVPGAELAMSRLETLGAGAHGVRRS